MGHGDVLYPYPAGQALTTAIVVLTSNSSLAALVSVFDIVQFEVNNLRVKELVAEALSACTAITKLSLCLSSQNYDLSSATASPMPADIERAISDLGPRFRTLGIYGGGWKPTSADWLANLSGLESLWMEHSYLTPRPSPPSFEL